MRKFEKNSICASLNSGSIYQDPIKKYDTTHARCEIQIFDPQPTFRTTYQEEFCYDTVTSDCTVQDANGCGEFADVQVAVQAEPQ